MLRREKSKERITAMVCANMDGSKKVPLLSIGKFEKPWCFRGIKCLPVNYKVNWKAGMDSRAIHQVQQLAVEL